MTRARTPGWGILIVGSEENHVIARRATCFALFGRDVSCDRLPGPYTTTGAEHFARCALLPDEEFRPLERFPDAVLAEYFNVPLEQVGKKRLDLAAVYELDAVQVAQRR